MNALEEIFDAPFRAREAATADGWARITWDRFERDGCTIELTRNTTGRGWAWSEVRDV